MKVLRNPVHLTTTTSNQVESKDAVQVAAAHGQGRLRCNEGPNVQDLCFRIWKKAKLEDKLSKIPQTSIYDLFI